MVEMPNPVFRPRRIPKLKDRGGGHNISIRVDDALREQIDRALLDHGVAGRASFIRQCVVFALFHIDEPQGG